MATRIVIAATDRDGRRLATREVVGNLFQDTYKDQKRIYDQLKEEYKDSQGVTPYIFTHTYSTN